MFCLLALPMLSEEVSKAVLLHRKCDTKDIKRSLEKHLTLHRLVVTCLLSN